MVKKFPNGFQSWAETHHEIVSLIEHTKDKEGVAKTLEDHTESRWQWGIELADQFEKEHKGIDWSESELTYFEAIDNWFTNINNKK